MKVVIDSKSNEFEFSTQCAKELGAIVCDTDTVKGNRDYYWEDDKTEEYFRTSPELINLIERYGSDWCSGELSNLKVIEIPDGVRYNIMNTVNGHEYIKEIGRVWY